MDENWAAAIHRLVAAHSSILRELLRHMVEENLMPPEKAARIVMQTAAEDLPPEESTGPTYDAAREELIAIATALLSWPGSSGGQRSQRPKPDPV